MSVPAQVPRLSALTQRGLCPLPSALGGALACAPWAVSKVLTPDTDPRVSVPNILWPVNLWSPGHLLLETFNRALDGAMPVPTLISPEGDWPRFWTSELSLENPAGP